MSEEIEYGHCRKTLPVLKPGDEVVISGIAGRFPESDNLTQLQENLFNKVDLVTDDDRRWNLDDPEIPRRSGKVNNLEKFDAPFFGINYKQAQTMDPMSRILLEHAYEAIIDAGVNPRKLRNTNTGVFIGAGFSESERNFFYEKSQVNGYGIAGCSRAMWANRISFWLGCTGPSYAVDTACSSSMTAMDQAYRAIRTGLCDAALIGGSNLCLHPYITLHLSRLGVLSPDGRCKTFDDAANGYTRSEAIVMMYLQKAKDAKRIHAYVVHTKLNSDGYKEQGITCLSSRTQVQLLRELYQECEVSPSSVAYVEAHGTGTRVGDPEELNVLEQIFCPGRTTPLRIGAVKSNFGHCEAASAVCSIAKIIVAMESGFIPPNLHYNRPREGVKALKDGRIQVVTEPTPWEGGYVGINSFGFGGSNVHILLKSNPKDKINNGAPIDDMPRLVVVSGRTRQAVTVLLDNLQSTPVDTEYIALLHNIHDEAIPGHLYRGYTILPPRGLPENNVRDTQHYAGTKRPVWFVFSGMGSQWAGMGEALLKIPVFSKAIEKCDAVLRVHGVNIIDILSNKDQKIFDNILNSFVGIAAVQIGLVDVLESIGIIPDNIIGHSVGELGCAYASGSITAEQMILAAHARGLASIETKTIRGSMAAVGLGYAELKNLCPLDIDIACHNGTGSATISGPVASVTRFVATLKANGIFVKEVPVGNIAYHSRYIAAAGPKLLAYMKNIVPNPKPRGEKWLSTSVPRDEWTSALAQLSSPEYHTNNLLNPVLFEETCKLIPNDAVTIEIAPHGLLQAVLRRSLNENVVNIALTNRQHENNVEHLLKAIGKMYEVGLHPQLANLYPNVRYPVSRGTPMISPLIRWEHSTDWYVYKFTSKEDVTSGFRIIQLSLFDPSFEWMAGCVMNGRKLLSAAFHLESIRETVGMMRGISHKEMPVVFEDVAFHRQTIIAEDRSIELRIMIHQDSGRFEISEDGTAVVTGLVRVLSNQSQVGLNPAIWNTGDGDEELRLTRRDIYKELNLRGYQYSGIFCGINGTSLNRTKGRIAWNNNWVTFMDNMMQMRTLAHDTRGLFVPTRIQKLVIDPERHSNDLREMSADKDKEFSVQFHADLDVIVSGGVEIQGYEAKEIVRQIPARDPVMEDYKFIAHQDRAETPLRVITRVATHIAIENQFDTNLKIIELIDEANDVSLDDLTSPYVQEILAATPAVQANVTVFAPIHKLKNDELPSSLQVLDIEKCCGDTEALLGVGHGLLSSKNRVMLKRLKASTKKAGFLLMREPLNANDDILSAIDKEGLCVILEKRTEKELVILLRKKEQFPKIAAVIKIDNNEFTWLAKLQAALKAESNKKTSYDRRILIVSEMDFESGLVGLVNCLRREPGGELIQGLLIQDINAPEFSLENPLYAEQLKLDLALNVLRPDKVWGSYRFLAKDTSTLKPVYHVALNQLPRGDLSDLKWIEGRIQSSSRNKDVIQVHYSAINYLDVMTNTGKLAFNIPAESRQTEAIEAMGLEYAGRVQNGRSVMGMCRGGAFGILCISDRDLLWSVPDNWALEEAATIPVAYGLAYYALYLVAKIGKGDKILIHDGSSDVGQAAIAIAHREGCEVFKTVGTSEERDFLKTRFPQIDDEHIANYHDASFVKLIIRKTQGRGVDVVLDSVVTGDKLQSSVRCLAKHGKYLAIGKFDLMANNSVGIEVFSKEITVHGNLLENIFSDSNERKAELANILKDGIKCGVVEPLVRNVFPMEQVKAAFSYMMTGKHIGKVLLKIRDDGQPSRPLAIPRYYCSEDGSYLIIGGLGGFGLELADWLVRRGAKKLVLTSRKGISTGYQRMRIDVWKAQGVETVIVSGKDPSTQEGCEAILKAATTLGPVDAIFNLAAVLKDGFCENQTTESFEESFRAKAWATKQLDKLSRIMCPRLRKFVVFSSVSCGRGYAGQTNYGMTNSVMERICEKRVAENLPGLAVEWGAIGDVGIVAEMDMDHNKYVIGGTVEQKISSCLQQLEAFLKQDSPVVTSMVLAEKTARGDGTGNVLDTVANIMGFRNLNTVSIRTPLSELGMDSMMAMEIRRDLERNFAVSLTPCEIRSLNFEKLQEMSFKECAEVENVETMLGRSMEHIKLACDY